MDDRAAHFLLSDAGRTVLSSIGEGTGDTLTIGTRLRKHYTDIDPAFLAAAMELADARRLGVRKFTRARDMYFTRESLEQATGENVAAHRAERFSGLESVCDLCAGIGGDSIALGKVVTHLTCYERDPVRSLFCRENLAVHGITVRMIEEDVGEQVANLQNFDAVFIDPSRRRGSKRTRSLYDMEPPLRTVEKILRMVPRGAVKLPPSTTRSTLSFSHELEWISTAEGLKEAVAWTGDFPRAEISVTLLHRGVSLCDHELPVGEPPITPAGAYLYEPDPALIRSELLGRKAASLGMSLISRDIAYMTADDFVDDPFFRAFRTVASMKFNLRRLEQTLNDMNVGNITVKKRGFPMLPEEVIAKLRLRGAASATVILTRELDVHTAFIVEPIGGTA